MCVTEENRPASARSNMECIVGARWSKGQSGRGVKGGSWPVGRAVDSNGIAGWDRGRAEGPKRAGSYGRLFVRA